MSDAAVILMLFDNVSDNYVKRIADGGSSAAKKAGLPFEAVNLYGTGRTVADILDQRAATGVILTPPLADDRSVLALVEERGLPMVRIGAMLDPERGSLVIMDEYDAARAVTEVLLDAGHRRVGFIRGPRKHFASIRRQNGFANAIGRKGLRMEPELTDQGDFSRASGAEAAKRLFKARPSAIFASNDDMALGVMDAAREAGLAIPRDLSLVGFDDNELARNARIPLTTVRQPLREMGEVACQTLVRLTATGERGSGRQEVPFEVIERDSVAPAQDGTS